MEICGFPFPPLDEEALFMPMTFDLSYFFDNVDHHHDNGGSQKKIQKPCGHGHGIGCTTLNSNQQQKKLHR
jgi:hypothetical protein